MLKDTSKALAKLRVLMNDAKLLKGRPAIQAYIVPSSDAHGSEYLSDKDKRRQFISGFTGSSGTAVITHQNALLWTDGRYFLQASQELDSNWTLMKDGLAETPTIGDWLSKNIQPSGSVGIDSTLYDADQFTNLANKLTASKLELIHVEANLVDKVWDEEGKPGLDYEPLISLDVAKDCGKRTADKLKEIRAKMDSLGTDAMVVTSLNEIAWLLNIRARDIPFGTVFFAYLVITKNNCKLFTLQSRLDAAYSPELSFRQYLQAEDPDFEFFAYEDFYSYFKDFIAKEFVEKYANEPVKRKIFLSSSSNYAIHSMVPSEFIHKEASYLDKLKGIKNSSEIEAAKRIHVRDSRVLVEFLYQVDKHFKEDNSKVFDFEPDEYTLGHHLDQMRLKEPGCLAPSFETICGFGPNGAIIHYKAKKDACSPIKRNNILLVDSGGHYRDMGTTDVTRTVYLGDVSTISAYQRECFTRVLKGHIQLALRVFPNGTKSELLDSFARQALWNVGLDYRHGTGHGVGALLNVHELPIIANRRGTEIGVQENMIITNEPGYYEENNFGIRIENCALTYKKDTKFNYTNKTLEFLAFEPLTYVPIQRALIDKSIMVDEEIAWLNEYHQKCTRLVGEELKKQPGKQDIYDWLIEQTKPL